MAIYLADGIVVQIRKNDDIYVKRNAYLFDLIENYPDAIIEDYDDEVLVAIAHSEFAHFVHMIMMNNLSFVNATFSEVVPMDINGDTYNNQSVILTTVKL